jgi:PEP-CTERM motif
MDYGLRRLGAVFAVAGTVTIASLGTAQAGVIPGPLLNQDGSGHTTTGIGFMALDNSHLTSFTFQNEGAADTIVLTNGAETILDSVSTPAGNTSDTVGVDWALSAGGSYWLLQTVVSNELYTPYGLALPSDSDIAITQSGVFASSIAAAVTGSGVLPNQYWAAFNNITTATVPEPSTWALILIGFAGLGFADYRRAGRRLIA